MFKCRVRGFLSLSSGSGTFQRFLSLLSEYFQVTVVVVVLSSDISETSRIFYNIIRVILAFIQWILCFLLSDLRSLYFSSLEKCLGRAAQIIASALM